jgi:DNA polymerase (family 10)
MKNQEVAKLLRMMAVYLEMKGIAFKPQAYEKAAYSIEALDEDIEEFVKNKRRLPAFGAKSEEKILKGIEFYKQSGKRFILGFIFPLVEELVNYLKESCLAKEVVPAGSYRRRKETVGDIDILAVSDKPEKLMSYFVSFPEVDYIYGQGSTKTMVC